MTNQPKTMFSGLFLMTKRMASAILLILILGNLIKLDAQTPPDSTADYKFNLLKLSELIALKRSFSYSDTFGVTTFLHEKKFSKKDTTFLFFYNDSLNQSLEFHNKIPEQVTFEKAKTFSDLPVLIFKSTKTAWKNILIEFIRQQKWNEEVVITENNSNDFEVEFNSLFNELRFFIVLYKGYYSLILL